MLPKFNSLSALPQPIDVLPHARDLVRLHLGHLSLFGSLILQLSDVGLGFCQRPLSVLQRLLRSYLRLLSSGDLLLRRLDTGVLIRPRGGIGTEVAPPVVLLAGRRRIGGARAAGEEGALGGTVRVVAVALAVASGLGLGLGRGG